MQSIRSLSSFDQLKLIADPRRLRILKSLMAHQASLTMLGMELGEHPAWVRHHLKVLEEAGLVELVETHVTAGVVEKIYRASAGGYLLQQVVLSQDPSRPAVVFSGSHDLAIEILAEKLSPHINLLTMPVGSLDGLVTLRQNLSQLSGCHLLDESGEYNLPFIHHFFPDRSMQVITLAYREQGLITSPGNPKSICNISDLAREDVSMINRNPGSGTRLWLDQHLAGLGIPSQKIHGYATSVRTHTESAHMVKSGIADATIGLRAAACLYGLDFIPLFIERYDIVFSVEMASSLAPLLDTMQTAVFRQKVGTLAGYETSHTGEQIPL